MKIYLVKYIALVRPGENLPGEILGPGFMRHPPLSLKKTPRSDYDISCMY